MARLKKILVPVDFSDCSENALVYAIRLANKINATIDVFHVAGYDAPPLDYPVLVTLATEEKIKAATELMKKTIKKATHRAKEFLSQLPQVQTNIEIGIPDVQICEAAKSKKIDYIIMGTQGQNSTWDKYLGSNAASVLKNAPCPVFVIPEKARFKSKAIMGYATNFLDADPFEIWKATQFLEPLKPKVIGVHLNENKNVVTNKMDEFAKYFKSNAPKLDISFFSEPVEDKVEDLNDFIDEKNINVMVMYRPKRGFFESIFHRSFTRQMAMTIEVPLLVLN